MSSTSEAGKLSSPTSSHTFNHFSLAEIQSATNDFDDELVIGKGGFGKVYKGHIRIEENIHVVAIKRLDFMSDQGDTEFRAEIEILSKLHHRHLVSLIGFCDDNEEMILVYEYMPNGILYHHLHKAETPLNWVRRLKIAIGAASPANNQSFSDVDRSVSVKGTFGYLDPEYFYTRRLTRKTDVFAFGVVLFELLSGRLAVDICLSEEQCSLVKWARKCVKDLKLDQLVDSRRPSMTEIVASLQVLLELHEKSDNYVVSSSKMRFAWKIHKYLVPTNKESGNTSSQKSPENKTNQKLVTRDLKKFTYSELQRATGYFGDDSHLGDGRYAEVHKGWIDKTTYSPSKDDSAFPITIKRLRHYKNVFVYLLMAPFRGYLLIAKRHLDLETLKGFQHPNLVKLLGYCSECEQLFLVYEFMPNGNLQDGLHSGVMAQLPLDKKVKIAVGIARAIVFLNKIRGEVRVREPQLQRRKILLDEEFKAKLSDYDITKLVDGDHTGEPSELECNLSGFTVVFAEVLTGKRISKEKEFKKDDSLWLERLIAKVCFEICNKGNSERQMLKVVEKYMNSKPVL
ncbi:hypothetical protein OSB04_015423 [Centaurea solstitialis]|uniref:Protein kinase domain-containing protein n=1 Tax=Centaurea solstitialis TaxID=347529 RepID=A0AA38TJ05_9ASTR|nr:hypothetical protein OSB04_015423 [Centaurea solstitialis]